MNGRILVVRVEWVKVENSRSGTVSSSDPVLAISAVRLGAPNPAMRVNKALCDVGI